MKRVFYVLLFACSLVSCEQVERPLLGTWRYSVPDFGMEYSMTFESDGEYSIVVEYEDQNVTKYGYENGRYDFAGTTDGVVCLHDRVADGQQLSDTLHMDVSVRGNRLHLSMFGQTIVYKRK